MKKWGLSWGLCLLLVACTDLIDLAVQANLQAYDLSGSLVISYPLESNANDASGNGNNGTLNGNYTIDEFNKDRFGNGSSVLHVGEAWGVLSDAYLDSGWGSSLEPMDAFTINLWMRDTTGGMIAVPGERVIFGVNDDAYPTTGNCFYLSKNADNNKIRFVMNYRGFADNEDSLTFNTLWNAFTDYHWHMLTVVHSQGLGGDKLQLYLDGALQTPDTVSGSLSQSAAIGTIFFGAARENGQTTALAASNCIISDIDDVRVYTRALDTREISALYHINGWDL